VGTLVGGVIPKSKKGKRKVREHARIARDLQSLAKTPLTDDNIVSMVEKGKVVFTNSTDIHGWDVPGQPSGPFIIHMVWNAAKGKLKPISQAKTKAFKASGKGVNLESNMVSKKILASYRAVKSGVKGAALAQEQADTHTKHLTERAVREALSKAGISKASLAKVVRGDANKLARFNRQLARDIAKRAASEARAHHLDHITLGRLTTAAAVGDRSAAAKLDRLAKAIEKSAVVPNRYQNIMGGKGLLELIKNG
jgi:phage-related protein